MPELLLELVLDFISFVEEVCLDGFGSSDKMGWRIFWGIILVVIGGVIWWELF
jgi:hypothetical protein